MNYGFLHFHVYMRCYIMLTVYTHHFTFHAYVMFRISIWRELPLDCQTPREKKLEREREWCRKMRRKAARRRQWAANLFFIQCIYAFDSALGSFHLLASMIATSTHQPNRKIRSWNDVTLRNTIAISFGVYSLVIFFICWARFLRRKKKHMEKKYVRLAKSYMAQHKCA